jgi:hypothetical protein
MKLKRPTTRNARRGGGKKTASGRATASATLPRRGTGRSGTTAQRTRHALRTKNTKSAKAS